MDANATRTAFVSLRFIDEQHHHTGDNRIAAVLRDILLMSACKSIPTTARLRSVATLERLGLAMNLGNFNVADIRRTYDRARDTVPTNFRRDVQFNSFQRVINLSRDLGLQALDSRSHAMAVLQHTTSATLGARFDGLLPRRLRYDPDIVPNPHDPISNEASQRFINVQGRLREILSRSTHDAYAGAGVQLAQELRGAVVPVTNGYVYQSLGSNAANPFLSYMIHRYPTAAVLFGLIVSASGGFRFAPFELLPWNPEVDEAARYLYISFSSQVDALHELSRAYKQVCNYRTPDGTVVDPQHFLRALVTLNSPEELSRALYMLVLSVTRLDRHAKVVVSVATLTRRVNDEEFSFQRHVFPSKGPGFVLQRGTSLVDIYTIILNGAFRSLTGRSGNSDDLLDDELVTITGLTYMVKTSERTQANWSAGGLSTIRQRDSVLWDLGTVRAFALAKNHRLVAKCAVTQPFLGRRSNCILEAFVYLQVVRDYDDLPAGVSLQSYLKGGMKRAIDDEIVALCQEQEGMLFLTLERLLKYDARWIVQRSIMVLMLASGTCTLAQCVWIEVSVNHRGEIQYREFQTKDPEDVHALRGPNDIILVYHTGHVFCSTVPKMLVYLSQRGTEVQKLEDKLHQGFPDPYTLKRIDLAPLEGPPPPVVDPSVDAPPSVYFSEARGLRERIDKSAADFETDACPMCTSNQVETKQECYCAGIAWGFEEHQSRYFVGQECYTRAKDYTFETFDGCVTQMLRWIMNCFGFCSASFQTQGKFNSRARHCVRYVYFFNGARFDTFFVYEALVYWKMPVNMVMVNSEMICLEWGNIRFVDFARLYPNCRLSECHDLIISGGDRMDPHERRKMACFPYLIIRESVNEPYRRWDMDDIDVWSWGDRFVDGDTTGESNRRWWREHVGPFYCAADHLGPYCMADVFVLLECIAIDSVKICEGEINGRLVDLHDCLTSSQRSMRTFQQCYLEESIETPDLSHPIDGLTFDPDGPQPSRPIFLHDVFGWSYKGGRVDVKRFTPIDPTIDHLYKEHYERTGQRVGMREWDANSMYPSVQRNPMPIRVVRTVSGDPFALNLDTVVDTDLYNVDIQYPEGKCGIMIKFSGYCISPSHIPYAYVDGTSKELVMTWIWGVELRQALIEGAVVNARNVIKFEAKPIFAHFIKDVYAQRLAAKDPLTKKNKKGTLNENYGKLAQQAKASITLHYSAFDLMFMSAESLINIDSMTGPGGDFDVLIVTIIDPTRSWIGQCSYMASFVTGGARATLQRFEFDYSKCVDILGFPVRGCYEDTDSVKGTDPDPDHPHTREWALKHLDLQELGKWKLENKVPYDFGIYVGRKLTGVHYADGDASKPYELTVELMSDEDCIIKSKGLHKGKVRMKDLVDIYNGLTVRFDLPDPMRRSLRKGITKLHGFHRTLQLRNYARQEPNEHGDLLPHKDLAAFTRHVEEMQAKYLDKVRQECSEVC